MVLELASIPIIVGLVAVVAAVLERAYKTFLEKRVEDPKLQFSPAYLLNALISSGIGVAVVTAVIPALITELTGSQTLPVTLASIIVNFTLGYAITYRFLDGLNNSTSKQLEVQEQEQ